MLRGRGPEFRLVSNVQSSSQASGYARQVPRSYKIAHPAGLFFSGFSALVCDAVWAFNRNDLRPFLDPVGLNHLFAVMNYSMTDPPGLKPLLGNGVLINTAGPPIIIFSYKRYRIRPPEMACRKPAAIGSMPPRPCFMHRFLWRTT